MRRVERLEARRLLSTADLNAAFGGDGRILSDLGTNEHSNAVAVQGDGKILVAGSVDRVSRDALVARYNTNGTLDGSFGVGGVLRFDLGADETFNDIRVLFGGKILLGGSIDDSATALLVRLRPDGKTDAGSGFGAKNDGIALGPGSIEKFALQAGKIVTMAGDTVWRYGADGKLDATFGSGGAVNLRTLFRLASFAAHNIAIQSDGRIVVTGDEPATVKAFTLRLLANGGPDNSFSGDGIILTAANGHALDAGVQSTRRIVVLFS